MGKLEHDWNIFLRHLKVQSFKVLSKLFNKAVKALIVKSFQLVSFKH